MDIDAYPPTERPFSRLTEAEADALAEASKHLQVVKQVDFSSIVVRFLWQSLTHEAQSNLSATPRTKSVNFSSLFFLDSKSFSTKASTSEATSVLNSCKSRDFSSFVDKLKRATWEIADY